ncbi:MAG: hypothetical protein ACK4X1_01960 [Terricaulis sp.]
MTLPFKIDYAIVCDQVRREDNGKLLFIGVYGTSLLLNTFPGTVALSLIMKVRPTKLGDSNLQFRAMLEGDELASGEITFHLSSHEPAFAGLPPLPLQIGKPGQLKWEARSGTTRFALLGEIPVTLNPSPIS